MLWKNLNEIRKKIPKWVIILLFPAVFYLIQPKTAFIDYTGEISEVEAENIVSSFTLGNIIGLRLKGDEIIIEFGSTKPSSIEYRKNSYSKIMTYTDEIQIKATNVINNNSNHFVELQTKDISDIYRYDMIDTIYYETDSKNTNNYKLEITKQYFCRKDIDDTDQTDLERLLSRKDFFFEVKQNDNTSLEESNNKLDKITLINFDNEHPCKCNLKGYGMKFEIITKDGLNIIDDVTECEFEFTYASFLYLSNINVAVLVCRTTNEPAMVGSGATRHRFRI